MKGYRLLREKVRVNTRCIRKGSNLREQQEAIVKYCGSTYYIFKGVLDGVEESVKRDTQNMFFVPEIWEND